MSTSRLWSGEPVLGYGISVYPSADVIEEEVIVWWRAGFSGTNWLEELASAGKATELSLSGFPTRYSLPAETLFSALNDGAHVRESPVVIGDDYVLPANWRDDLNWRRNPTEFPPQQELTVLAWDLG